MASFPCDLKANQSLVTSAGTNSIPLDGVVSLHVCLKHRRCRRNSDSSGHITRAQSAKEDTMHTVEEGSVRLLASADSWIDGAVVGQLYAAARLEGVREVIAFPDVYPASDFAIGTAVLSEVIHPRLTGTDFGCGVGLWKTDLRRSSIDRDEWSEIRFDLE